MQLHRWLRAIVLLLSIYILSGCASYEAQKSQYLFLKSGTQHRVKDGRYLPSRVGSRVVGQNNSKRVKIVFYRLGGSSKYVPTVKVNNRVVGSLLPNNYAKTYVYSRNIQVGIAHRGNRLSSTKYHVITVGNSGTIFMKVLESYKHKFTLKQIDPKSAKEETRRLNLESNIINRYVPHKEKLHAPLFSKTIYFRTGSSTADKKEFKKIKAPVKLTRKYKNLTNVVIKSYADYRGSQSYNKKLAYNRAISVKRYFQSFYPNSSFNIINHGEIEIILKKQNLKKI